MSGIISKVQLKWKNTLLLKDSDQTPKFCSRDQYALNLLNILDEKWRARSIPNALLAKQHELPRSYWLEFDWVDPPENFSWNQSRNFAENFQHYSSTSSATTWLWLSNTSIVCLLFIWTLCNWVLCCPYLPTFRNRFVHTSSAHLIILFAASVKTLSQHHWWQLDVLMIMTATGHTGETLEYLFSLFSIIVIVIQGVIENSWE